MIVADGNQHRCRCVRKDTTGRRTCVIELDTVAQGSVVLGGHTITTQTYHAQMAACNLQYCGSGDCRDDNTNSHDALKGKCLIFADACWVFMGPLVGGAPPQLCQSAGAGDCWGHRTTSLLA